MPFFIKLTKSSYISFGNNGFIANSTLLKSDCKRNTKIIVHTTITKINAKNIYGKQTYPGKNKFFNDIVHTAIPIKSMLKIKIIKNNLNCTYLIGHLTGSCVTFMIFFL
jgi:hypothetical protein